MGVATVGEVVKVGVAVYVGGIVKVGVLVGVRVLVGVLVCVGVGVKVGRRKPVAVGGRVEVGRKGRGVAVGASKGLVRAMVGRERRVGVGDGTKSVGTGVGGG